MMSRAVSCTTEMRTDYEDFMPDLLTDLEETLSIAEQAGIKQERIILDPGCVSGRPMNRI